PGKTDEFVGVKREDSGGIDLPHETQWRATLRRRLGCRNRSYWSNWRYIGYDGESSFGLLCDDGELRNEWREQHDGRAGAETIERRRCACKFTFCMAVVACVLCKVLRAERDEIARLAEVSDRVGCGIDQFAVSGKSRGRFVATVEQTAHALGQRQVETGTFAGYHEDRGCIVGKRDARAEARQRRADTCTEAAQSFEPRRAAVRQRQGEARDLRGSRMCGFEFACRECGR